MVIHMGVRTEPPHYAVRSVQKIKVAIMARFHTFFTKTPDGGRHCRLSSDPLSIVAKMYDVRVVPSIVVTTQPGFSTIAVDFLKCAATVEGPSKLLEVGFNFRKSFLIFESPKIDTGIPVSTVTSESPITH